MPFELGGRADKLGNSYEIKFVIYNMIKVLEGKLDYVKYEGLGIDEDGVDLWLGTKDNGEEGCQCKARNGIKENWTFKSVSSLLIFTKWKRQLSRQGLKKVSLVSPLSFINLTDLLFRAKTNNNNPSDFYEYQINTSNRNLFTFFCEEMSLNPSIDDDIKCAHDYLSRISYKQFSAYELELIIKEDIKYHFVGDYQIVYNAFYKEVASGILFANNVTQTILYDFIRAQDFQLRDLSFDTRVIPRINELNKEFKQEFKPLITGEFERGLYKKCKEEIDNCNSLLIYGKAGSGKSGCTMSIIRYCETIGIRYLALKLDKNPPISNPEKWGEDLGLSASIVHCIHDISRTERAVIILDQLDVLRWTQSHSRSALTVCEEIINQAKCLNLEREFKISIVFVCRTYDLVNDRNINSLFDKEITSQEWKKIEIDNLEEPLVKQIIGKKYDNLTDKLKILLSFPSNIFIWQHLDQTQDYDECHSTSNLVLNWIDQLGENYDKQKGIVDGRIRIEDILDTVSRYCNKSGENCIPLYLVSGFDATLKYLNSNGLLIRNDKKVSFTHQSILDCWLANSMIKSYYINPQGSKPLYIIGNKDKQTPQRRYQFQIFLQNLYEYEDSNFLDFGKLLLEEKEIRFSFKFVFFEVLNQLSNPSEEVASFIIEYCKNEKWRDYIIDDVISSKPQYFSIIREDGIVEEWLNSSENKQTVFKLLSSICNKYGAEDVLFIRSHSFICKTDDIKFIECFPFSINQDSDDLFELRMEFYKKYPSKIDGYFNFKNVFKNNELRAIRYFACLLNKKIKIKSKNRNANNFSGINLKEEDIEIHKGKEVLSILLPQIPSRKDSNEYWSSWDAHYHRMNSLERVAIFLLKKANQSAIKTRDIFLKYYKSYMGVDNYVYNELLLDALNRLPISDSDWIVSYLYKDFDKNIFDNTSSDETSLFLGETLIKKYSKYCNNEIFRELEEKIIHYISPKAKKIYKLRRKFHTFNPFWGEFQYRLLNCLPKERCSEYSKKMLFSLRPKFENSLSFYANHSTCASGFVLSSVTGKNLTSTNWIGIITNDKIKDNITHRWDENLGTFISSSKSSFASSFSTYVSKNPNDMISRVFITEKLIDDVFIDSLFDGIWISDCLETIATNRLEELIIKYYDRNNSNRSRSICNIIEKLKVVNWSKFIIDIIIDIAINNANPCENEVIITNDNDKEMQSCEMLRSNAFNCTRGQASFTISSLLWVDNSYFEKFKGAIEHLIDDRNAAVRFSSLYSLFASYNIDKDWASRNLLSLINRDLRFAIFDDSRTLFNTLVNTKYHDEILEIIVKCYNSNDEELVKIGSYCIADMFVLNNEFNEQINNIEKMSEIQATYLIEIFILYFDQEDNNKLIKEILLEFIKSKYDLADWYGELFIDNRIDLERDHDFILKIMNSKFSEDAIYQFLLYFEENSFSFLSYEDIIIEMSKTLIDNYNIDSYKISDSLVKFVIGLYDEVSEKKGKNEKRIANQCLDLWDSMFEKGIDIARQLNQEIMNR